MRAGSGFFLRGGLRSTGRTVAMGSLLALAGCSALQSSPTGQALALLQPGFGKATAEQAANIEFASLALDSSTQRGLLVMGAQTGEQTHWPMAGGGFLSLYHNGLFAMATPQGDLLATRYRFDNEILNQENSNVPWQYAGPITFTIERQWVDDEGLSYALNAEGTMTCGQTQRREMLLTTLPLQLCQVNYRWANGQTTRAQWWREPTTLKLWEVEEPAWPNGPEARWQVARPWWNS